MTKIFVLALALLAAIASATAGPFSGTLIVSVMGDQVRYAPGSTPQVSVTLQPPSGSYIGHLDWVACNRTTQITAGSVTGITVASGASSVQTLAISGLPSINHRGYMVFIAAYASSDGGTVGCTGHTGSPIDTATRGIDISNDWAKFPRGGWNSTFLGSTNETQVIGALTQFGINYLIFYDVDCQAHRPYCAGSAWTDLEGETVAGSSVAAALSAAHGFGMAAALFEDAALADSGYSTDGSGAALFSGLFNGSGSPVAAACGTPGTGQQPCNISNQSSFGSFPIGWRTASYYLMNPGDGAWQSHLLGNIKAGLAVYPYDAFQADTLGAPAAQLFDAKGNAVNPGAALADFTNTALAVLHRPAMVNSVSLWAAQDVALRSREPAFFAEMHPEFGDYPTFTGPAQMAAMLRQWTSKTPVMPAYINKSFAATKYACAPPPASYKQAFITTLSADAGCYINAPGAELADWAFLAAGIDHLELGDYDLNCAAPKFADNEFWKGPMLCMSAAQQAWLYNLAQMQMGYENLFFDAVPLAPETIAITSGGTASTGAVSGDIAVQARSKPGFAIWDFTNLSAVDAGNTSGGAALYQDSNATMPAPSPVTLGVTVQVFGTIPGGAALYAISPDWGGQPKPVSYTTGSGTISATLPAFTIGLRLVLETSGLSGADYDIAATQMFRGAHYNDATPGCGTPLGTTSVAGSGGCWVHFSGVQFGSAAPSSLVLTAIAPAPAGIDVRLDQPGGLDLASGIIPAGSSTVTAPLIAPAIGRHDIYIRFVDRVATIGTLKFQ